MVGASVDGVVVGGTVVDATVVVEASVDGGVVDVGGVVDTIVVAAGGRVVAGSGVGDKVVVGPVVVTRAEGANVDGAVVAPAAVLSSPPPVAITQTMTATRNTKTTPITAGMFTDHRSPVPGAGIEPG